MRKTKRRPPNRWRKICFLFILIFIFLLGVVKLVDFTKKAVWDGHDQFNLVINSQPIVIASFAPNKEKLLNLLIIPEKFNIDTIHGYGSYRIESIFDLGQLDGQGEELFTGSIENYFGLPIDGYISEINIGDKVDKPENAKKYILKNLAILFKEKGKTNLNKWDLIRLWWFTRKIHQNKIKKVDLGQISGSLEIISADGTKVTKPDPEKIDKIVKELFIDQKIVEEDLSLSVLNGTSLPGLAQRAARLIDNIGGRVLEIGNLSDKKNKCEIKSKKTQLRSYTLQKLIKIFNCDWTGEDLGDHRTEVVLILGEEYWEKISKKKLNSGI